MLAKLRWALFLLLFAAIGNGAATAAYAHGQEWTKKGHDCFLTVDSRWAGTTAGGYCPIRVQLVNRGPARRFRCELRGEQVPSIIRSVDLAPNATANLTLPVPMVSYRNYSTLYTYINGTEADDFRISLSLPEMSWEPEASLLLISDQNIDLMPYLTAARSHLADQRVSSASSYGYTARAGYATEVVHPSRLPELWVAYSGLDLVAVQLDTFASLPATTRQAILKWVGTGGRLLLFEVGSLVPDSASLQRVDRLVGAVEGSSSSRWQPLSTELRNERQVIELDQYGNQVTETVVDGAGVSMTRPKVIKGGFQWKDEPAGIARQTRMFGAVDVFSGNPFPGGVQDWYWFLRKTKQPGWIQRYGYSPRAEYPQFLEFLIPGVAKVPVVGYLFLITIFSVVIGPLNFYVWWKRKRLYLLLVTIPVIAFVTSITMFTYSLAAHGWSIKSRVRSFTWIDQPRKEAVSVTRLALYAGLSPSDGLRFSPDTAVFPIWQDDEQFRTGSIDWTENQHLSGNWVPSRTRTQFLLTSHKALRSRLTVKPASDGKLPVENGLEWELRTLVAVGDDGTVYFGENIPAGAATSLLPMTAEEKDKLRNVLHTSALMTPDDFNENRGRSDWFGMNRRYWPRNRGESSLSEGQTEMTMEQLQRDVLEKTEETNRVALSKGTYLAVVNETPDLDLGLLSLSIRDSYHLIFGNYD